MLIDRISGRMAVVWLIYFSVMEFLSLLPSQASSCVLISEEADTENYAGDYACASMHEAIFRLIRYIWDHANHDNVIAVGTVLIATFTYVLYRSTDKLWEASERQINLARDEFISSHRPKIRIKHIWFASQDGQSSIEKLESGKPVVVRIDIVNIGGTTAFLSLFNFMIRVLTPSQRLPQRPPYNEPNTPKIGVWPFRVNSGITFTQHLSDGTILSSQDIQDIRSGIKHLFVFGTVEYWDDESRPSRFRQTGFCRRLDFELPLPARPEDNGRFRKVKDPDYEYQD
jgi:hypothetical protein